MILAIIAEPFHRDYACGFLFNTDIQSEVEQFLDMAHHNDYYLTDPETLTKNMAGNYMLPNGRWVWVTRVDVDSESNQTSYTFVQY